MEYINGVANNGIANIIVWLRWSTKQFIKLLCRSFANKCEKKWNFFKHCSIFWLAI